MSKYSSKLGEKVFLTEEDFIELKLSGKPWTILIPEATPITTTIITEVYNTTNLFSEAEGKESNHFPSQASPRIKIRMQFLGGGAPSTRRVLVPEEHYYIITHTKLEST